MNRYLFTIMLCGFTMILSSSRTPLLGESDAQVKTGRYARRLDAIVKMNVEDCGKSVPIVPEKEVRTFPQDRINKTLHGIWRGRVSGEIDKKFTAADGFLDADYYMIVDVKRGEALTVSQFGPVRSTPKPMPNAPVWSFLMCGDSQYVPPHPPQIHEFQKVSNNLEDARAILESATGVKVDDRDFLLSATWQKLVERKYFENALFPSYVGGLFKPFKIGNVVNRTSVSLFSMNFEAEYRGSGMSTPRFESGVPISGSESAQFVGVTLDSGDFLVSSFGNGVQWKKASLQKGQIDLFIEKVIIGPLNNQ